MNKKSMKKTTKVDFATYIGVTIAFVIMYILQTGGHLSSSLSGQLVPICCFIAMAVSLNLVVGISGELSLGHAGFMSVGAFSGVIAGMSLADAIPSVPVRLAVALIVGAICAAITGVIESMAKAYISTNLANSIVFAVLIIVLLVKPTGLLGKYAPEKV